MLNFEIKKETARVGKRKGHEVYFAQRVHRSKVDMKYVTEEIVQRTAMTRGDVTNVIMTMSEVVNSLLKEGIAVDLGDLGSFSIEARGKQQDNARAVTADTIKTPQIRYNPKHEMRRFAQRVRIEVKDPDNLRGLKLDTEGGGSGGSDTEGGGRAPEGGLPL